jgi:hypothetical protein
MSCWANSTATCEGNFFEHVWQVVGEHGTVGEGGGVPSGFSEEGRWVDGMVGTIFITAIVFATSAACSSLNVTTDDGPGLSGGELDTAWDIGGW